MFGLGRAAVPSRAPFQSGNQIVVQIPNMQVSSHQSLDDIIDLNDLKCGGPGQEAGIA